MKNLQRCLAENQIQPHTPSRQETAELLGIVDRDLEDARITLLSSDRRFATAYNAALQLSTTVLHAAGYRTRGAAHHWTTFAVLAEIMGSEQAGRARYFNACRSKRNVTDYDSAGSTSEGAVTELIREVEEFKDDVIAWLARYHPDLMPG